MKKPKSKLGKLKTLIREVVNWPNVVLDKTISKRNIIYKFRTGVLIECRPKSTDINEALVVLSGIEYPKSWCTLDDNNDNIVFDIGSNIGAFSIYVNKLNAGKKLTTYAFEPHPDNMYLTKINLERNSVEDYILSQKAISDSDGMATFDVSGSYDSLRLNRTAKKSIQVETLSLSSYCHTHNIKNIDLLKMDIEGGEYDVFNCDLDFIKENVVTLLVEYHNTDKVNGGSFLKSLLEPEFTVVFENVHPGGGMLLGKMK